MRPNANQLAMRDPAIAALMGVGPGAETDFGSDFGADFGAEFGDDYGAEFGEGFGDDYGADAPAAVAASRVMTMDPRHPASPTHPANQGKMMALWAKHHGKITQTKRREMLLDPNADSTTKVERYSFTLSAALVLGVAVAINVSDSPATKIRPKRVLMNAPAPGFVYISEIKVSNVSVTSGAAEDAFGYSAPSVDASLDMPTLTPSNKATVQGNYTGFIPASYVAAAAFPFTTAFRGPATLAGG